MENIFENEYSKVTYEEDLKILNIIWTEKRLTFEEYQRPFTICLNYMKKKKVDNYISDIRKQTIISPEFRKWLQDYVLPEAVKAGLKRIVVVANVNVFKQYYINNVFKSASKFGIPLKTFNTLEEAKNWFKSFT